MKPVTEIIVNWNNKRFRVDISRCMSVGDLKRMLCRYTCLIPDQHNLVNLKFQGESVEDDCDLDLLNLNPDFVLCITNISNKVVPASILPEDLARKVSVPKDKLSDVLRVDDNDGFKVLEKPRDGKRLLVLDIDRTIYDYSAPKYQLKTLGPRRYLQEFLVRVYEDYDIGLWSVTSMEAIKNKVLLLGIQNNHHFKISFYVSGDPMVFANIPQLGLVKVKSLNVIWQKFEQYNVKNTIMCDDQLPNFVLNQKNGLLVRPYSYLFRHSDDELLKLACYLKHLAQFCGDFSQTDHTSWRERISSTA